MQICNHRHTIVALSELLVRCLRAMRLRAVVLVLMVCAGWSSVVAQSHYVRYIDEYKEMAIEQMKRYGIPASITLAQGLLESGAGQSTLARKANNHFGIKVGSSWNGPYVKHDDDARNEKFRKYKSAKHSYEDHSKFLRNGARYAFLFELDADDYKGWAHGLKRAGYATNPRYAHQLIDLIERFELHRYDKGGSRKLLALERAGYRLLMCNDSYYVEAKAGDNIKSLSKALKVSKRKLRKYNEVSKHHSFKAGDRVYITKKQRKAAKPLKHHYHEIAAGQSLHTVAQLYGVRLKTLYRINDFSDDYVPRVGDRVLLRK